MDTDRPCTRQPADESELLRLVRTGDTDAYGRLFTRHREAALAQAARVSRSSADAEDLLAEGSAKVLGALLRGGGPDHAFRAYLLKTIRHLAYDRTIRERRESPVADTATGAAEELVDPVVHEFDCTTAVAAFATLPDRWQWVLWQTEVEGLSVAQVAEQLDLSANAVAALAYRAREGLRQAYLTRHALAAAPGRHACRLTSDRLASYIRGGLTPARHAQVAEHLAGCRSCCAAYQELTHINHTLRAVVGAGLPRQPGGGIDPIRV